MISLRAIAKFRQWRSRGGASGLGGSDGADDGADASDSGAEGGASVREDVAGAFEGSVVEVSSAARSAGTGSDGLVLSGELESEEVFEAGDMAAGGTVVDATAASVVSVSALLGRQGTSTRSLTESRAADTQRSTVTARHSATLEEER